MRNFMWRVLTKLGFTKTADIVAYLLGVGIYTAAGDNSCHGNEHCSLCDSEDTVPRRA